MKALALAALLVACACSPGHRDQEAPASEAAPPPVVDTWPGKYEGDLLVRIDQDHKAMVIEGEADGCTGDVGMVEGGLPTHQTGPDTLRLELKPGDETACMITLVRSGDVLTVSENEACRPYHGATCTFNGTAKRVK